MKTAPKAGKELSFQSKLENWEEGMDYCAIPVPAAVTKSLGTTSAVLVMARVNASEPFKVSLFPVGGGKHYIRVRAKVRKAANLKEGDRVKVRIVVLDRADVTIPKDLAAALRSEGATADFDRLTPGEEELHHPPHRRRLEARDAREAHPGSRRGSTASTREAGRPLGLRPSGQWNFFPLSSIATMRSTQRFGSDSGAPFYEFTYAL